MPAPAARPPDRHRLAEIRDNLLARIAEARDQGWLGELEGLQISLEAARQKLGHIDQITNHRRSVPLGMPTFSDSAGRNVTGRDTLS